MTAFPGDYLAPGDSGHEYPDTQTPYEVLQTQIDSLRSDIALRDSDLRNALEDVEWCLRNRPNTSITGRLRAMARNLRRRLEKSVPGHES